MDNQKLIDYIYDNNLLMINKYIESFLMRIEPNELMKKIDRFGQLDFNTMSDKDIADEISNILIFENLSTIVNSYSIFRKGTRFYRVRKLNNLDIPNENLSILSDFWNPPKKFVSKYGRLNKVYESLLYTAFNPLIAIKETHISKNDFFAIIVYKATRDVQVSWIGSETNYKHHNIYNKKAITVHELYKNFLINEFTKEIPSGQENCYRITEHIAKKYYVSPSQDGWRYPSVKDRSQYNICFKSESIGEALNLIGAIIGTCLDGDSLQLNYIAHGFDSDKKAVIYDNEDGYEFMKKIFPEFIPRSD